MEPLDFLHMLYELCPPHGSVELRKIPNTGGALPVERHFCTSPLQVDRILRRWTGEQQRAGADFGIFFAVALRNHDAMRGRKQDVLAIPALWADIDVEKEGWNMDRTIAAIKSSPLRPSVLVRSGHGLHAYWCLEEPIVLDSDSDETLEVIRIVEQTMKRLTELFGGDRTHDITRVLRLPGTLNTKKGGKPKPVEIIYADWNVFDFIDLSEAAQAHDVSLSGDGWLNAETAKAKAKALRVAKGTTALANSFMASADLPNRRIDYDSLWKHTTYMGGDTKPKKGTAWIGLDETILRATAILYAQKGGEWTDSQIVDEVLFRVKQVKERDAPRERWDWKAERQEIMDKLNRFKPRWERLAEERRVKNGKKKEKPGTDRGNSRGSTDEQRGANTAEGQDATGA